jgi:hypothetical protein
LGKLADRRRKSVDPTGTTGHLRKRIRTSPGHVTACLGAHVVPRRI